MVFKKKKKYGQNFLTNSKNILDEIINVSCINENDTILEIGPGDGALTKLLLEHSKRVFSVEIDNALEGILRTKFGSNPNFQLIMGDILQIDLEKLLNQRIKVVANIPYYITSPIIQKLIDNREKIDEIYIMVQKEVAQRICAKSGKERSVLTLSVEYYGDATYLFTIPKEYFSPVPKIDSAFISIKLRRDNRYEKIVDKSLFFKYVKAAFSNKRKNIVNNLSTLGFSKNDIREKLELINIGKNRRAESISIDEYIKLIQIFENKKSGGNSNDEL